MGLNRSSYYLSPATESEENLHLMRLIDQQFLRTPFYGSRRMTASLERSGETVNRKRVQRLMALMGLDAIFPKPRTTGGAVRTGLPLPAPRSGADPRQRGLEFGHHGCSDAASLHVPDGGDRLVEPVRALVAAVNALEGQFCLEALDKALSMGRPEIFNANRVRGSQGKGLHQPLGGGRDRGEPGRSGAWVGQRVRGATVEEREIRRDIHQRL